MLITTVLPRIFTFKSAGKEIKLTDPNVKFTVEQIRNFYSSDYPVLTTATIEGPEIKNDQCVYHFATTLGTKG